MAALLVTRNTLGGGKGPSYHARDEARRHQAELPLGVKRQPGCGEEFPWSDASLRFSLPRGFFSSC